MKRILLTEYQTTQAVELSQSEVEGLRRSNAMIQVQPTIGLQGAYDLTPSSRVGVIRISGTTLEIRPRIPIRSVLFLISYAVDPCSWKRDFAGYEEGADLVEAIIPAFVRLVSESTHRGLLHGYRSKEEALATVRGRIRFDAQIRDRFGILPPIEVRFDEFTEDIDENRILRAALRRLMRLPLRSTYLRRTLNEVEAAFHAVSVIEYVPSRIPAVQFDRLNAHYRRAIGLAQLILQSTSLELSHGNVAAACLLVDTNEVFEAFVHKALQEALDLTDSEFPRGWGRFRLDGASRIKLKPDLCWMVGGRCVFVGDVKYKRLTVRAFQYADNDA